jgi:ABC-2 type transport system permease protein
MRTLRILLAKELNAILASPIGYTVAGVFLLVLGYTFSLTLFATKVANLQYIFHQMYVLSILLVPVLTMRSFAEERRSETLELLLTAPVRDLSIVLAKYTATLTFVLGMFALSLVYALILDRYGEPDWGPIYAGYLALVLHASLLVAVGLLMSSLTENQVVAAALSIGAFLMLWFAEFGLLSAAAAVRQRCHQPVVDRSFQANGLWLRLPVRCRLFRHRKHGCSFPRRLRDLRSDSAELMDIGWFIVVVAALAILFATGLTAGPHRLSQPGCHHDACCRRCTHGRDPLECRAVSPRRLSRPYAREGVHAVGRGA